VIVAINKDEEAPIFQVARLTGPRGADLFQVLPELSQALEQAQTGLTGEGNMDPRTSLPCGATCSL